MPVTIGTQLGSHEITALLGKGGMGEVYRARDTKLKREVAIKILPEEFLRDPDRVSRFQREAEVLASLNHPNIAAIYDLEEAGGSRYLVLELVEGETLADRIQQGPIPIEEGLDIAKRICEALEAAHEKGIIHRDLKPANVKITPDGKVKVLDFGLAKAMESSPVSAIQSNSPTIMSGSMPGVILGTAAYMSPEQARGQTVDKRADIWSFGVVLYEMLTGRRLFEGESFSDTLAAVLMREPEWDRVPPKACHLLRSCLEKDPRRRLRDIGDAWRLIERAPGAPAPKSVVPWVVATLLTVIAAVALWGWWSEMRSGEPPSQPLIRLDLDLGPDVSLGSSTGPTAILSPDGTRLVFVSHGSDAMPRLLTRRLDEPKATQLAGTDGAYSPFFSPDGQWVGFFAGGKLKKTRVDGGQPVALFDAPAGRGASWSEDGSIIAALDIRDGLSRIAADGGKVAPVTERELGELSNRWPHVLPGGKAALFSATSVPNNYEEADIAVVSLEDRHRKIVLAHAGLYPRYLPSGHIIYVKKGALFAVPFNVSRLEVGGAATSVLEDVSNDSNFGFAQLDFSRSGTILYHRGGTEKLNIIQWLDGAGKTESVRAEPALYAMPRVSPDGSRLALAIVEGPDAAVWVYDWRRGTRTRLTVGPGVNTDPVWSPDGRYVVFQAAGGGIFWTPADGADKPKPLTKSQRLQFPTSFTPDGSRLALFEQEPGGRALIKTVPLRGNSGQPLPGEPELFLETPTTNSYPAFSPDGRWLAYASSESGVYEVYVRAFPDRGTKRLISTSGGNFPVWSRNGRELFYRTEDQRIMVATYTVKGDSFAADTPRVWSERQLVNTGLTLNFDLAPDGKRFAVLMPAENPEPRETRSHLTLVLNFFDEVRRRAPAGKQFFR
jgi:Tol biopolymer transport system component/tRNA A-37 threonylcarbamoyl transferase component Bud32